MLPLTLVRYLLRQNPKISFVAPGASACRVTAPAHAREVSALEFSSDNTLLLSASQDNNVILWDVVTAAVQEVFSHGWHVERAGFLGRDDRIIASTARGDVWVWDIATNLTSVSDEERVCFNRYYVRMNFLVVRYLLLGSPLFLLTIILPIVFLFEAKRHVDKLVRVFRSPLDKVDSVALTIGKI